MMGQLSSRQNALFYDFSLEKCVPADHLLRRIDAFLDRIVARPVVGIDLSVLRQHLHDYYSPTG